MSIGRATISVKGKSVEVPSYAIGPCTVVVTGSRLKIARLHDAEWDERQVVDHLDRWLEVMKGVGVKADIFTFCQTLEEPLPHYSEPYEIEDVAAVPVTTYQAWWDDLPQESRKNVRKAEKRGLVAKVAIFDDTLVAGIKGIYDETPIRQGRQFWHYGKDLAVIRRENSSFLDRSDFVAAYLGEELVGFIKLVYVGKQARIMQILSKNAHADKKTPNLLLAKAMEVCAQKGMSYFIYGKYFYGSKGHTPITEFKRRNGFKRLVFPCYYVPLTLRGRVAVALRLHLGLAALLPAGLTHFLLNLRSRFLRSSSHQTTLSSERSNEPRAEAGA